MGPTLLMCAGLFGFLGVALGAFGAHGLKRRLEHLPDAHQRADWWRTAAQYNLVHALALGVVARAQERTAANVAGLLFVLGIVLFSGSLYVMSVTGMRKLGAVTPIGGMALLGGWVAWIFAA